MNVEQLIASLSKLDPKAQVQMAHLMKDRVHLATFPVAATAERQGHVLLCDRDVALVLLNKEAGAN